MHVQVLSAFLAGYDDAEYLVNGFTNGFRLGYSGQRTSALSPNLKSCIDNPDTVTKKLNTEVALGRIRGPFECPPLPNLRVSPIGLVPKKAANEFRLIHHLSFPHGSSINDHIDPEFSSVHYATFDDAIAMLISLGTGTLMAKTDIADAFRLIPVHPDDHNLLGISWDGSYYYDTCLPMGASSSCAIFETFSSSLQWISNIKLGIRHMLHILDDFLFFGVRDSATCQESLDRFIGLCSKIGVPIKHSKTETPRQVIVFMGLELDSVNMIARLPQDKLCRLRSLLSGCEKRRKIKLRDLQSLLGLLNFCCAVVRPGRAFLRRLIDMTKGVVKPHHRVTFNVEGRRDLKAWQLFATHFNGKHLLLDSKWITDTALHFFTDASGALGFGAVFRTYWFYGPWPSCFSSFSITVKELFPIVLALEVWGKYVANKCLILHSDNMSVVHILNKQSSCDKTTMVLVRRLVISCMTNNVLIRAIHIPGRDNVLPDLLSRLQVARFRALAPQMAPYPTVIPAALLQPL